MVSGALLWWVFRGQNLAAIAHQIAAADPAMLAASGALVAGGGLVRAIRWRLLLEPLGVRTTFRARWAALNIGFMVTNVFPARLGEIVRPLALSRMAPVSMSAALGTVLLERVLDAVAILVLVLVTIHAPAFPEGAMVLGRPVGQIVVGVSVVAAAVLGVVAFPAFRPERILGLGHALAARLPDAVGARIAHELEALLSGLRLVRRPAALVKALLWSLVLWMWMAAAFWTAFRAFGLGVGFTAAMFTECLLSLFEAIPAGPGFVGTLQAGVLVSLHDVFGVPAEPTLSMAVGYHVVSFVPVTLIGLYYAWRVGLHLRSIGATAETALESGPGGRG